MIMNNQNKRTAIIYSIEDLGHYIIQIWNHNKKYYIGDDAPIQYANLADARKAAKAHQAEVAYLALSKTYEEVDSTTENLQDQIKHHDYMLLTL
jgi:hypothetical protein